MSNGDTQIASLAVQGTSAYVTLTILGQDIFTASVFHHEPGTGRWLDQFQVKLRSDPGSGILLDEEETFDSLAFALAHFRELYAEVSRIAAEHRAEQLLTELHREYERYLL